MPPAAQAASVRKDFFRALELPELDEAVRQATSSLTTTTAVGVATAESSIATVTATATVKNGHGGGGGGGAPPQMWSACPHWVDYLPSKLDLTLYPCAAPVGDDHSHNQDHSSHKNHHKWILKEPVHALHLQSQLEQGCCLFSHDEPILYGEEQERWMAVCTEGFPETYHPWIQSTTPAKAAKLPQALASSSSSSRPRSEAAAAFHLPLPALNHATTAVNRHHLSAEHVPTPLPDSETTLAPSSSTRTTTMPPTLHDASSSFVTATHKSKLATAAPASLHTTAATLFVDATKKSISSGVAVPPPTTWSSTVNKPTSTPATVAATVSAATLQTPPQQPDCSMDIQVDASTTTTSPLLVPPHYLPESTYLSLQFLADQIALLRRYFLAQRTQKKPDPPVSAKVDPTAVTSTAATTTTAPMSATTAPTTTGATRKRKTASGGTSSSAGEVFHPPPLCQMPAWKLWHTTTNTATAAANRTIPMARSNEDEWHARQRRAAAKVEVWMEHYRQSRQCYWSETTATRQQSSLCHPPPPTTRFRSELSPTTVFGSITTQVPSLHNNSNNNNNHSNESGGDNNKSPRRCTTSSSRSCQWCQRNGGRQRFRLGSAAPDEKTNATKGRLLQGDDLMQCLECSFTGCCPSSVHPLSNQHIVEHFLTSNHKYAVSCGRQARVYCFQCGDFVYHEIFEKEKERIDLTEKFPWQAWKEHPVQRSFDALQFLHIRDLGIFWSGMQATYPIAVPREHSRAAQLCRERQIVFQGEIDELPLWASRRSIEFTARQHRAAPIDRWRVPAPVGMYNLGNTCFMSAILHCLVHCVPLQRYFLRDIGHNHTACAIYRKTATKESGGRASNASRSTRAKADSVCLACEMDKLFLRYMGSTHGLDVLLAVNLESFRPPNVAEKESPTSSATMDGALIKGDPLIVADMLTAAWKCGGMNHLAGYEQRDAHEFLHGFLEILGKHVRQYRMRMYAAINAARPANSYMNIDPKIQHDEIKNLFQGTLRSVLVCRDCGSKRIQSEPFMSISLPLSKEDQKATSDSVKGTDAVGSLSVERCLRHFTLPEILSDPVDCPDCGKKTPTKKQHVVAKLPKVLCLHLKRFDSALNKKIEDFVSFPSTGLNMGPYLPHWCEVSGVPSAVDNAVSDEAMPQIAYDLFATVNHFGNLQSGHYVTNVKVKNRWFHCNDSHVSYAGVGNGEAEVLRSEGAYLLFYVRR